MIMRPGSLWKNDKYTLLRAVMNMLTGLMKILYSCTGMLDYMIWPFMERIPLAQKFVSDEIGHLPEDRFSKLVSLPSNL